MQGNYRVQRDDAKTDNRQAKMPDDKPQPTHSTNDGQDDALAQAGSEPGDTHPVFGNNVQPQEIVDKDVIGTNDVDGEPFKGENTAINYDPENDARMQDNPED